MQNDRYSTLSATSVATLKIQRSEFTAIAFPVATEAAFFDELQAIQKRYYDANHHCWAWRLFADGSFHSRSSDAGEPSGTAGRPILNAIEGRGLADVAVVVVRFFGGIRLGTGGLARAYRDAAHEALREAPRSDRYLYAHYAVEVPFAALSIAYRLVSPPDIILAREEFGEKNVFFFDVRRSRGEELERTLTENRLDFRLIQV